MSKVWLRGARILTERGLEEGLSLLLDGPKIAAVGSYQPEDGIDAVVLEGCTLVPGFTDLHCHGGGGEDFMSSDLSGVERAVRSHLVAGTTTIFPTSVSCSKAELLSFAKRMRAFASSSETLSSIAGLHIEGPYISPEFAGAQPREVLRDADIDEVREVDEACEGMVKIMTYAPERPGAEALTEWLMAEGRVPAIGHTAAPYELGVEAIDAGMRHVSHAFNAMRPIHHREPGLLLAALLDPRVTLQVIADGVHIHRAVLRLLYEVKGPSGIALVTDATAAAFCRDGNYRLSGEEVVLSQGAVRNQRGNLAGSALSMVEALRNIMEFTSCTLNEACAMASSTPARVVGLDGMKGSLKEGYDGDIVVLDGRMGITRVYQMGRLAYEATSS